VSLPASQRTVFLLGPEELELRRIPVLAPGPGEILVRIGAATTCGTDVKVFRRGGHPRMLKVPTPFGHEMAGTVAASGPGQSRFQEGERVVVANSGSCGVCEYCLAGRENLCLDLRYLNGAFAEFLLVPARFVERSTLPLPDGLPFEIAALTEPLACVIHGIDGSELRGPSDLAVYGAGPIGLLFVAALSSEGHRVVLADPNPSRLAAGRRLGAAETVVIERGGGQAPKVAACASRRGGFDAAVDATGLPEVWADTVASVRPGGLANLFGGCAPGSVLEIDTHRIHYSEITLKGVYHHRPATFRRALELLASGRFDARVLLSAERPLEELEEALRSMMRKEALKVVVRP
jgi:L-iditol 2-dehydrogenase